MGRFPLLVSIVLLLSLGSSNFSLIILIIRQHNRTAQSYLYTLAGRQLPSNLSKAPNKLAPVIAALDTSLVK